jgi:DNA ligase-1
MRLEDVVRTSAAVRDTSGRLEKIARLAELLERTPIDELDIVLGFLSGAPRQGRIGVAGAAIRAAADVETASMPSLDIRDVDAVLQQIANVTGAGSSARRVELLADLFRRTTVDERNFLVRLLYGELRQGALEGVLLEAVARASRVPAAAIRRAAMLEGALAPVARNAMTEGEAGLRTSIIQPFKPVQPMLAESAADVASAVGELGETVLEYKLDGARVQVHKAGVEVRVYSRTLRDVTAAIPEVVEAVRRIGVRDAVLDGEVIALRAVGKPHPFQVTMKRFGSRRDTDRLRNAIPVSPFFFDCLYADGGSLVDEPLNRRLDVLGGLAPPHLLIPRRVTAMPDEAEAFMDQALASGHEGLMAKSLVGAYAAGRRGQTWRKIKRARTLDLAVLAVEWGNGRRQGTLSNLHLGARDAERGGFVMLGKTFKGLTDAMLAWQTKRLLALETGRDHYTVYVRPELVVEIAFNDLQESPHYPGRLALRFARVKRYREDKSALEADTFQTVQRIYEEMTGLPPPEP